MAVKLRLQRKGRKKAPFYHIVAADARAPRDGRFIEKIGTYNPLTVPATIVLDRERAYDWLMKGAQPTDTVRAILRFKGIMYQKHLAIGVKKGAMTEEEAQAKLNTWIEAKEARIAKRREATEESKKHFLAAVDGSPKPKAKPAAEEKPAEAPAAEETPAAEVETPATAEATAPAEEPQAETAAEPVEAKTEAAEEAAAEEKPADEPVAEATAEPAAEEPATEEAPAEEAPAEEEKKED